MVLLRGLPSIGMTPCVIGYSLDRDRPVSLDRKPNAPPGFFGNLDEHSPVVDVDTFPLEKIEIEGHVTLSFQVSCLLFEGEG